MKKSRTIKQHLGKKLDLEDYIYEYPTKNIEGYTMDELLNILEQTKKDFPNFNQDQYDDAMLCNTCMLKDDEIIIYHCDVLKGFKCGLENRGLLPGEWD